jgi:predicted ATPase/class 3 adenylate cyclase
VDDSVVLTSVLFTDIEGSTRLWEQQPEQMQPALACHDALARIAVEDHGGMLVKTTGDGIYATFGSPLDAVNAAVTLQLKLADPAATCGVSLRARCGLHAGIVERRDKDFFGGTVNRAARLMGVAHGGQVVLSQAVVSLIGDHLPLGIGLRDLGPVRLKDLSRPERVYQVLHAQLRQDFPALRSLEATPNNLPQQITSFVGHERALTEVRQLLGTGRLVTVVGVGGLGKTRLSLQVGAEVLDNFSDGVWFVELAPLSDPGRVPQAVASVVGVKEEAGRPVQDVLPKFVKDRQLLLILDNCEHLAQASAELAKALLQAGAQVRVLATSREALHVAGEATYQLSSLSVPDPKDRLAVLAPTQSESVRLFIDRAIAAQQAFRLTPQNVIAVVDLCHRLDGIPLALELAAAQVRALTVEAIDARLSERFRLLTGGDRTVLPRQQTLRACIDWSYDLLTEVERALLRRLAVFAGGWTLEAAQAVGASNEVNTSDVLKLLTHLVEKSLVEFDAADARYRMLETIREYVLECLQCHSDMADARSRHFDYFLWCAETAEPAFIGGPDAAGWTRRLTQEQENLRAAMAWSLELPDDGVAATRMCGALSLFWVHLAAFREGRDWCEAALRRGEASGTPSPSLIKTLLGQGAFYEMLGDSAASLASCSRALELSRAQGERLLECRALQELGNYYSEEGDYASARALYVQAMQIANEIGSEARECASIRNLAHLELMEGNMQEAHDLAARALEVAGRMRSPKSEISALAVMGTTARNLGDLAAAAQHIERALIVSNEVGLRDYVPFLLSEGAGIAAARGDRESARSRFRQALSASQRSEFKLDVLNFVDEIILFAADTATHNTAALLGGAVDRLRVAWGHPRGIQGDTQRFQSCQQSCRKALGAEQYEAVRGAGGQMTVEEVFLVASELLGRAQH